jgi:L-rhamnose mutarotase
MKRYGFVIKVRPEKLEEYKILHANSWPEILQLINKANIRNYTIFYRDGLLFSYYEYIGKNYEEDMAIMAKDKKMQEWWQLTVPCQQKLDTAAEGDWWSPAEEVYHND